MQKLNDLLEQDVRVAIQVLAKNKKKLEIFLEKVESFRRAGKKWEDVAEEIFSMIKEAEAEVDKFLMWIIVFNNFYDIKT